MIDLETHMRYKDKLLDKQIALRLPSGLWKRILIMADNITRKDLVGRETSASDVIRHCIEIGIEKLEDWKL